MEWPNSRRVPLLIQVLSSESLDISMVPMCEFDVAPEVIWDRTDIR